VTPCFECGRPAKHRHHVVPRVLGGRKTVGLCETCHPKAHGKSGHWNTSELTKRGLETLKAQGKFCGGAVPFGWKVRDGWLLPSPKELAVRQLITVWRRGGVSLWGICRILNRLEIPTKHGRNGWKEGTIRKICQHLKHDANPI
jgi:hypothetical protein